MKDQQGNEIPVQDSVDRVGQEESQGVEPKVKVGWRVRLSAWWHIFLVRRKLSIPIITITTLLLLAAIPWSRYPLFGLFLKQEYAIQVTDSHTGKPVSNAAVSLGSATGNTDANGEVTLKSNVGSQTLKVEKKYYEFASQRVTVPLTRKKGVFKIVAVVATGRQVPVSVRNNISGQALANITIKAADTEVITDEKGQATIVLPATGDNFDAELSGAGVNTVSVKIKVGETLLSENEFSVTPSGKIYFLSKQSGKLDVVKTDLDGGNRQTVLAGTGKEEEYDTALIASRDWRYLALKSKRDGGDYAKLFLIDTQKNDEVVVMDEGEARFDLKGWAGHHFIYQLERYNVQYWVTKKYAIKSYSADARDIVLLDETQAFGDAQSYIDEKYSWVELLDNRIMFFKYWAGHKQWGSYTYPELAVKQTKLTSIAADGQNRKELVKLDVGDTAPFYTSTYVPYESYQYDKFSPREIYFHVRLIDGDKYYKTSVDAAAESNDALEFIRGYQNRPTYHVSPDGNRALWNEARDGKAVVIVADPQLQEQKEIASLERYGVIGWYTNEYVLLSKEGSQLSIMSSTGGEPQKISDYHSTYTRYNDF